MGSLSEIFQQHLTLLTQLRGAISNLEKQRFSLTDTSKTWAMVDDILKLLEKGSQYLDFPDDPSLKMPLPETKKEEPVQVKSALSG